MRRSWLAIVVLAVLGLHAATKIEGGLLDEMLWGCHVASLLIAIGLLARQIWLCALGTVFHLAIGIPAYLLYVVVSREVTLTSVLAHLLPPCAGLLSLRGAARWPRWTPVAAGALYVLLIPLCRAVTDPKLNVNLAFAPWPPIAPLSSAPWISWLANCAAMAVTLPIADRAVRRWLSTGAAGG